MDEQDLAVELCEPEPSNLELAYTEVGRLPTYRTYDDALLRDLERTRLNTAKHHDAQDNKRFVLSFENFLGDSTLQDGV